MTVKKSALYSGWVRHRRYAPKEHKFVYKVFMLYLDLAELDEVFSLSPFWSHQNFAIAKFERRDFHGNADVPLPDAVRQTIKAQTGLEHTGPIRMLANLRYFGFNINPLCTYYCFDPTDTHLQFMVAEVTNTPWGERQAYVLHCQRDQTRHRTQFAKRLHVSPFNPLEMQYQWTSTTPSKNLLLHIENWQQGEKITDATLQLQRESISAQRLNVVLIRFPFMTVKIAVSIYWQALRLWLKKVPIFDHPKSIHNKSVSAQDKGTL